MPIFQETVRFFYISSREIFEEQIQQGEEVVKEVPFSWFPLRTEDSVNVGQLGCCDHGHIKLFVHSHHDTTGPSSIICDLLLSSIFAASTFSSS